MWVFDAISGETGQMDQELHMDWLNIIWAARPRGGGGGGGWELKNVWSESTW